MQTIYIIVCFIQISYAVLYNRVLIDISFTFDHHRRNVQMYSSLVFSSQLLFHLHRLLSFYCDSHTPEEGGILNPISIILRNFTVATC